MDLDGIEAAARQRLDQATYDYFAGGAGDELTLSANLAAWSRLRLRPRVLRDVSRVSTATTVLGRPVEVPLIAAPVAYQRLLDPSGEIATARAMAGCGGLLVLSTRSSCSVEEVAAATPGASWWFQVYVMRDRNWTEELVLRAAEAGASAVVLTVDTPVLGRRKRDIRNHFVLPEAVVTGNLPEGATRSDGGGEDRFYQSADVTPDDVGWLGDVSSLPVVTKGVLRGDDAGVCLDAGAAGVVVSNHGGRQLDGTVATADVLAEVVDAVQGRGEVYVDGGIRRGSDVVKALALGARAVMVGRPLMWGLTAGGEEGVASVVHGLGEELATAMALCGAASPELLTPDLVVGPPPG